MDSESDKPLIEANKIAQLNQNYEASMLECYRIEAELWKYRIPAPKIKKPTKAKSGLVTPEAIAKVKELMVAYPKGAKGQEFTVILGLCGIAGVKQTGDARAELVEKGVIIVEGGEGAGRSGAKLIKLVQE